MNWRILRHDTSWRYCADCVEDDVARHRVAYWHRTHQVPGLVFCPEHGARLIGRCQQCGHARSTLDDLELPGARCECIPEREPPECDSWDAWLANLVQGMKENGRRSLETTQARIREGFGLPDRVTGKHRPRIDEALTAIELAIGREKLAQFFEFYGSADGRFRGRTRPNLLYASLTDSRRMMRHPLYFLVAMGALEQDGDAGASPSGAA